MIERNEWEKRIEEATEYFRMYLPVWVWLVALLLLILGIGFGRTLFSDAKDYHINIFTAGFLGIVFSWFVGRSLNILAMLRQSKKRLTTDIVIITVIFVVFTGLGMIIWQDIDDRESLWTNLYVDLITLVFVTIGGWGIRLAKRDKAVKDLLRLTDRNKVKDEIIKLKKTSQLYDGTLSRNTIEGTNFSNQDLSGADLAKTKLVGVNLGGADLYKAHFSEMIFDDVKFNKRTTLPSGEKWTDGAERDFVSND